MTEILLPVAGGSLQSYRLQGRALPAPAPGARFNRIAYSAAHVVADPFAETSPHAGATIDWERTIAYRRHLAGLGLGIAEAMDTAQRGMGLDWPAARELITRSMRETRDIPGIRIASGCGTDQLDPRDARGVDDVLRAYMEQLEAIQSLGGRLIMMASRALARVARSPEDYRTVYRRVLSAAEAPVILHWLGDMFDPALAGYWGHDGFDGALRTCLEIIEENRDRIDGIKISLLDDAKEVRMRRLLPAGVRMYTGDDFNYPALIAGDAEGHSDALLGIFDAIAPAASLALAALAEGDTARFHAILEPTVPLSRRIFGAPTQFYKTGVVFLAYLNGHQEHFIMVGGQQSMRPLAYFTDIFRMADAAGLLRDPEMAAARMRRLLALYGVGG
ncbi:dihydrodipicolinate synthase family protein [Roseomonas sp. M0104]|uniref:Dihydrodipicolinate synthase family protein n=1 Tax=Teichococcus coralli TaxID=2545983 RepID=A0A845BID7_9PROT|nr:dihydrodipicolinate synthase family protein [Pseudoroseomonas coralli]MXP65926.1 dihydrodipicolinate synthase family protein [Pseudoroseomonas coralli]